MGKAGINRKHNTIIGDHSISHNFSMVGYTLWLICLRIEDYKFNISSGRQHGKQWRSLSEIL